MVATLGLNSIEISDLVSRAVDGYCLRRQRGGNPLTLGHAVAVRHFLGYGFSGHPVVVGQPFLEDFPTSECFLTDPVQVNPDELPGIMRIVHGLLLGARQNGYAGRFANAYLGREFQQDDVFDPIGFSQRR